MCPARALVLRDRRRGRAFLSHYFFAARHVPFADTALPEQLEVSTAAVGPEPNKDELAAALIVAASRAACGTGTASSTW